MRKDTVSLTFWENQVRSLNKHGLCRIWNYGTWINFRFWHKYQICVLFKYDSYRRAKLINNLMRSLTVAYCLTHCIYVHVNSDLVWFGVKRIIPGNWHTFFWIFRNINSGKFCMCIILIQLLVKSCKCFNEKDSVVTFNSYYHLWPVLRSVLILYFLPSWWI